MPGCQYAPGQYRGETWYNTDLLNDAHAFNRADAVIPSDLQRMQIHAIKEQRGVWPHFAQVCLHIRLGSNPEPKMSRRYFMYLNIPNIAIKKYTFIAIQIVVFFK